MTVDMDYFSLYESYQEKYNHLKQKFVEVSSPHVNATNIQTLKDFYDNVINSKRASDDVKDLLGLMKILEKRSVLLYNRIEPLKHIATSFVQDPVLNKAINEYELQLKDQQNLPSFNVYKCKSGEYFSRQNGENFSELTEVNPLQEILNDSKKSRLLNSKSINSQSSTDELLNNEVNNQNNHSYHISYSNTNLYRLNNINTVYNINNNHNNNNFKNSGFNNSRSRSLIVITQTTMVLLIVTITLVFITNYLKHSVLTGTSISSVSTTDAFESSGSNQSQSNLERISYFNPTTNQPIHPHQQASTVKKSLPRPSELQSKVFRYLSENLGRSWRDLVRFLGVKEAEIDFIDSKNSYETKDKVLEALNVFQEKCDPCNWQKILIKSLETVRRKDLAENVTDMILAEKN